MWVLKGWIHRPANIFIIHSDWQKPAVPGSDINKRWDSTALWSPLMFSWFPLLTFYLLGCSITLIGALLPGDVESLSCVRLSEYFYSPLSCPLLSVWWLIFNYKFVLVTLKDWNGHLFFFFFYPLIVNPMNCLGNALDTPPLRGVTFEGNMCVSEHKASQMSDNFIYLFIWFYEQINHQPAGR